MSGAFTGNLANLGQLARNLGRLAAVPSRFAAASAPALADVIRADYAAERDPYGNAWAPLLESTLKRKGGDPRIKRRSDLEFTTVNVTPAVAVGVRIEIESYEGFHTGGTVHMDARPSLPTNTFPASWRKALNEVRDNMIREARAS